MIQLNQQAVVRAKYSPKFKYNVAEGYTKDDTPQASTEDEPESSSKSKVLAKIQVQRRRRLQRDDTPHASSSEGNGQQTLKKQAPLVSYGAGVRQTGRKEAKRSNPWLPS